ncbi:muconolactone delta-isomerase [Streptomyces sp. CB01635]|uniref:muconolactone Delta-isomerase family protein n=1 Tax=unclassified Streptomyces TaxID=2593676 RepID=UPI000C27441E|nr:muconolactone Delta-isomerase family protein [Streptomyces sp. CB01635]PJN11148.1 muconolactone delta-isomerase [Streptomyces sp. CB01635]
MEHLVTMTTHVPEGTSQAEVDEVRAREAAHSRRLAERGQLLRLWRPPLHPGEWRTLGLFAAQDAAHLEDVLSSMPLRVWRSDEVTPLTPHPNDPGPASTGASGAAKEFLVTFAPAATEDATSQALGDATAAEAVRAKELAGQGHLVRLWKTPGERRALGLWRARDAAEMQTVLDSLPQAPWLSMETTPLSEHPSDPGAVGN